MPLKPGSSSETVGENIRELHTGDTYAHTSEKFGKERANKQAVAIALSEARKHRASGGRAAAERVLPANHQLGMRVPDGGSNCAKCRFFKAPRDCDNKGFIEWNGSPRLPDPADRYCCDLYLAPARGRAEGGALSDDDEAAGVAVGAAQDDQGRAAGGAMNGAVRQAIARAKGGKIHVGPIETDHGGRTDTEEMKVPDGAYVLPADAISHMGENNSQAGR